MPTDNFNVCMSKKRKQHRVVEVVIEIDQHGNRQNMFKLLEYILFTFRCRLDKGACYIIQSKHCVSIFLP